MQTERPENYYQLLITRNFFFLLARQNNAEISNILHLNFMK